MVVFYVVNFVQEVGIVDAKYLILQQSLVRSSVIVLGFFAWILVV
jgi:hypothetical protein